MKGSTWQRCGCRDADGKKLGSKCPKLGKRNHGTWNYAITLPTGADGKRRQRHRGGFATKTKAEEAMAEALGLARRGQKLDDRITVGQYLDGWLKDKTDPSGIGSGGRQISAGTEALYRGHVNLLTEQIGRVPLTALTAEEVVTAYRAIAKARGIGAATQNRVHATLRAALNRAVKRQLIPTNPALAVDLPSERRDPIRPWEPAELGTFLDAVADHDFGPLFEVIAYLGLRRGEALGMRWSDLDLDAATLTINQTWQGRFVDGEPVFGPPKTAGRTGQTLDLPAQVVDALKVQQLRQQLNRADWRQGYRDHGLVFARVDGQPLTPAHVSRTFGELARGAGLRPVRLHDLRHGTASLMLAAGAPLELVSKTLGHTNVGITSKTYSHLLEGVQRAASTKAAGLVPRRSVST